MNTDIGAEENGGADELNGRDESGGGPPHSKTLARGVGPVGMVCDFERDSRAGFFGGTPKNTRGTRVLQHHFVHRAHPNLIVSF